MRIKSKNLPGLLLSVVMVILFSCPTDVPKTTKRFVVLDKMTNRPLNAYEYETDTKKLVKIDVFNPESLKVTRSIEYATDAEGNILATTERRYNGEVKVTQYSLEKQYDASQKLIKTVQTTDTGKQIETFYGYDETGTLRGAVQKNDDNSLLMKDYD